MAPLATEVLLALQTSITHLRADQLGYRPLAQKAAIPREPKVGFDAPHPSHGKQQTDPQGGRPDGGARSVQHRCKHLAGC